MRLDSRTDEFSNACADRRADGDADTNPNRLIFGKSIAFPERLPKPDGRPLRLSVLRDRSRVDDHVRVPGDCSRREPDRYVDSRVRTDRAGCAWLHHG